MTSLEADELAPVPAAAEEPPRAMLLSVDTSCGTAVTRVTLAGEIDLGTAEPLRRALADALDLPGTHVVVDLARVTYIDSTGLGEFIRAHKRLRARNATLTLEKAPHAVLRVFRMTGIDHLVAITGLPTQRAASA